MNRSAFLKSWIVIWTIIILLFVSLAGSIKAQKVTSTKKTGKHTKTEVIKALDKEEVEVAEEYAYLLEQLLYLSSDYCRYFEKVDDKASSENYQILANLCSKLSDKRHYENIHKLMAEIETLKGQLAEREDRLQEMQDELEKKSTEMKQASANLKSLKLTTSLRDELEALDEQLKSDVVRRVDKDRASSQAIQNYVCEIIDDSLINYIKTVAAEYASRVHVIKDKDGKNAKVVIELPDIPEGEVVYVPDVPEPAEATTHRASPRVHESHQFAGPHFFKEIKDSITVSSSEIPVYVTNSIGDLHVSSWANKKIKVQYIVMISAEEFATSEQFEEKVDLRIFPKQNKIFIETLVPPLSDPKMRVLESRLELQMPAENNLFVSNSSGNVVIDNFGSNVVVKATSCNVELNRVSGNAEISNSSGDITAAKVRGNVVVQNRMGLVTLTTCTGAIEIDNSFGDIAVNSCNGNTVIHNTGAINIGNHTGNVEITNRSGPVDVSNLNGNLAAFNSFEPLSVQNISGTAKLINANSDVDATNIAGMASINNRFGQVSTSLINGPVYIENKNGDIVMELAKAMSGPSTVVASGGQVLLSIAPRSNLFLTMELLNGDFDVSGFNATIQKTGGGKQTAQLTVGNGSNAISVKGSNSRIVIKPTE